MDLEDLGIRYREISLWKRLVFLFILAVAPGGYNYWDRHDQLMSDQQAAQTEKKSQEDKLRYALEKHQKLAKLEENLIGLEKTTKEVSKKFPDEIQMDHVLEKTELITQQLGLSLKLFQPKEEIPSETAFKFLKMPIGIQLVGTFGQITNFFDHLVHLDFLVNLENIDLAVDSPNAGAGGIDPSMSQEKKRAQMRLRASCDMSVFRSLNEREAKALQTLYDNKRAAEKAAQDAANPPAGAPPPPEAPK